MKGKTPTTNVRLPATDKKKAIKYGFNISEICRHALRSRVRNYEKRIAKEAQQTPAPIARAITPDQVTLAGSPVLPQCSGIAIPAEAILDNAIAELGERDKGDPEGSPRGEVTTPYGCSSESTKDSVTTGTAESSDREVAQ